MLDNQPPASALQQLTDASRLLNETLTMLDEQKAMLRERGMTLPPMATTTLKTVDKTLQQMEAELIEGEAELRQLRALAEMSAGITTSLDVDTVLNEAMDIIIALTRAERGYIILVDDESQEMEFRVSREDVVSPTRSGGVPQISRSVLQHVMRTGEALLADNAFEDVRFQGNASVANFSLRSVLCVPLLYKESIIGVAYVDNRLQSGVFTEREKSTLVAFANTAAVAITNALLYADIQQLLTQITSMKDLMDNIFASIGSGVIATDAHDMVQTFNRAAASILSRTTQDTLGKPLNHVLPKISADFSTYLTETRETGESHLLEGEFFNQEKRRVAVSVKLTPLRDAKEQTQGVAVVMDDITRQLEQNQQLDVMRNYLPPEMVDNIHTISNLALGGERRHVTCLFVEVRPFDTLKKVRPKEIMDIVNIYLDVATAAIHETKGIIDKYMGNEVMALYNTQLSPETDHAYRCIEAALLMRDEFIKLYEHEGINPEPHFYRAGMHTGECTLGNVGSLTRRDFTAIGDTINLSKRLQENATRGQIILSEETLSYLKQCAADAYRPYKFRDGGTMQVKGRVQPVQVYEVFRA